MNKFRKSANSQHIQYDRQGKNAGQTSQLNGHVLCEQRRFWSSWPQDAAPETRGSLLSGPCWQDPHSTGVVLPWEAAVSVERTIPAKECHTSQDAASPTGGALQPKRVHSTAIPLYFLCCRCHCRRTQCMPSQLWLGAKINLINWFQT